MFFYSLAAENLEDLVDIGQVSGLGSGSSLGGVCCGSSLCGRSGGSSLDSIGTLEAGGNDGNTHLILEVLADGGTEDDVGVGVGGLLHDTAG